MPSGSSSEVSEFYNEAAYESKRAELEASIAKNNKKLRYISGVIMTAREKGERIATADMYTLVSTYQVLQIVRDADIDRLADLNEEWECQRKSFIET